MSAEAAEQAETGEAASAAEGANDSESGPDGATDGATRGGSTPDGPNAIDSLIGAFLEAGPEATEHLIRAAHELVLAAQAVVDAAQRALREQQDVRSARRADADETSAPFDAIE
jgi:hypothetical protein